MTRHPLVLVAAAAFGAAASCNRTADPAPFAREEPQVELQGLAVVAAGALGQFGVTLSDTAAGLTGGTPGYLQWARTLADTDARPDELREAILGLVRYDYGRRAPYTHAYAQFARKSPAALVRAAAVRALNISRDAGAIPLYIESLDDAEPLVRLEAAKALVNLADEAATPPLLATAQDAEENLDVRIAAIDALKHYTAQESLRVLVRLLESNEFSLAWQARRSLVTAMRQDHGFDLDAWRRAVA